MEKLEKRKSFWMGLSMLMIGIVIGFLTAPARNGMIIKQINGNHGLGAKEIKALDDCLIEE